MKKLLLLMLVLGSLSAFADISPKCKEMMDDRIEQENITLDIISEALEKGEITEELANQRLENLDFLAEATAALCSIQRLVRAQNSIRGKLGLTSLKRAERIAEKESSGAMLYYKAHSSR